MEEIVIGSSNTSLFVDGLDYTNVELHDFTHGSTPAGMRSVVVTGGPSAAAGLWQGGVTNIFTGNSFQVDTGYDVSNGAHVMVRDVWTETVNTRLAYISGLSTYTFAGSWTGTPPGTSLATITDLQGSAAFVNDATNGSHIRVTGSQHRGKPGGLLLATPALARLFKVPMVADYFQGPFAVDFFLQPPQGFLD